MELSFVRAHRNSDPILLPRSPRVLHAIHITLETCYWKILATDYALVIKHLRAAEPAAEGSMKADMRLKPDAPLLPTTLIYLA
jgi:hypothetical protein